MPRHRRLREPEKHHKNKDRGEKKHKSTENDTATVLYTIAVGLVLVVVVIICVQYWSYSVIARLYQPLNEPKMVDRELGANEARKMLWGTYRYL